MVSLPHVDEFGFSCCHYPFGLLVVFMTHIMIRCESSQAKRMYFVLIHSHLYECVLASLVLVYESGLKIHACCMRARGGARTSETRRGRGASGELP